MIVYRRSKKVSKTLPGTGLEHDRQEFQLGRGIKDHAHLPLSSSFLGVDTPLLSFDFLLRPMLLRSRQSAFASLPAETTTHQRDCLRDNGGVKDPFDVKSNPGRTRQSLIQKLTELLEQTFRTFLPQRPDAYI